MRLWFGGSDNLIGFVWPAPGVIDMASHFLRRDIEPEMLAWGQGVAGGPPIHVAAMEGDEHSVELFRSRGYEESDERAVILERKRGRQPVEAPPVDGYSIRCVRGIHEAEQRAHLMRAIQPQLGFDALRYGSMMRLRGYRGDLDLIAQAPDGALVAGVNAWFDFPTRTGLLEPLGCVEAHRRRGVARALVAEAIQRLESAGASRVLVQAAIENEPARALHASLGFEEVGRRVTWVRNGAER